MRTLILPLALAVAASACSAKKSKDETKTEKPTNPDKRTPIERPPGPDTSMQIAMPEPDLAPPLSLTAADGTGLALTRLDAKVVVDGPISFTELHLSFRNPQSRVIEGRFAITLPQQATISRLSMQIGSRWQEAEVVERQAARRAYEDFLHRKQDPALLEKEAGNEFRARIFPIPGNSEKNIIVSYSQPLVGTDAKYRLHLRGLPRVQHLKVQALVGTGTGAASSTSAAAPLMDYQATTVEQRDYVPTKDFEVAVPSAIAGLRTRGLDGGDVVAARIRPNLAVADEKLAGLAILFDTSASRALGYATQVDRLGKLIGELAARHGAGAKLIVAAFDQTVAPVYEGTLGGFGTAELDKLRTRRALGASDLHSALSWVGARAGVTRVLIITDGIATAGPTEAGPLRALITSLKSKLNRLDVILTGGIRAPEMAERLVRGTLARDGVALDGDQPVEVLARRISQTTVSGIKVQIADARWVWPHTLDGVQPGDEYLVFARMAQGALRDGQTLGVGLSGGLTQAHEVPLTAVAEPLLVRATVNAEVARLTALRAEVDGKKPDAKAQRDKLKNEIIALSTRYRVLSDYTALLVLETEADYRRFGIARTALADILTVGERGIELVSREQPYIAVAKPPPPPPRPRARPAKNGKKDKKVRRKSRSKSSSVRLSAASSDPFGDMADETPMPETKAEAPADFGEGEADDIALDVGSNELAWGGPATGAAAPAGGVAMDGRGDSSQFGRIGAGSGTARSADNARVSARRPASPPLPPPPPSAPSTPNTPTVPAAIVANNQGADTTASMQRPTDIPARPAPRPDPAPTANGNSPFQDSTGFLNAPLPKPSGPEPLTGKLAEIMRLIKMGQHADALKSAQAWRSEEPGDLMALIALGESLEAGGQLADAARAYGSIIDLFPSRADMRRFAGERLDRLVGHGAALAADSYAKSVQQRPDHMTGHRLLAMALLRMGLYEQAFAAAQNGLNRNYPSGRFRGGQRILREDLGLIAAAWLRAQPKQRGAIVAALKKAGAKLDRKQSLRFVLTWETDANDVDFHIHDGKGGHAYYANSRLPSGGQLYADVTTGYGPECFTIPGKPAAFPYTLRLHYYSRGPMGFGMGKLEVVEHDGKGRVTFEQRPFVVMNDGAYVDVGQILPAGK